MAPSKLSDGAEGDGYQEQDVLATILLDDVLLAVIGTLSAIPAGLCFTAPRLSFAGDMTCLVNDVRTLSLKALREFLMPSTFFLPIF